MGFAVPAYECWLVPIPLAVSPATPVCYTRTFKNKNSTLVDSLLLDIFPATLNEFIATELKEDGGFGLKWDAAFRSLPDEDGDGLLSSRNGGFDPDDREWDADFDGLSDSFELQQQQDGVNMSPVQADSDGDGLTDAQELRFGTNPGLFDSDNDGLSDGAEIRHRNANTGKWEGGLEVRINSSAPRSIWVSSDPNARDSDGDGVSDAAEYQLAGDNRTLNGKLVRIDDNNVPYHPNVVNTPPVRIYVTSDAVENRYVKLGQQFLYTTTVVPTAPLDPGVLDVAVLDGNGAPSNLLGVTAARYGVDFSTNLTSTQQTAFTANAIGSVSVTNTVRTQLAGSGLGPWQLGPTTGGSWSFNGVQNYPQFTAAAPTSLDRPDQYLMTTKAMPTSNFVAQGDIKVQGTTSAPPNLGLDEDTSTRVVPAYNVGTKADPDIRTELQETKYLYGPNAPDVACNETGNCMVVWDHIDNCSTATINSIEVLKEGTDGSTGIEPVIYLVRDFNDTDPTDGGYELLWNARPAANGGNQMQKNEIRGPNEKGFPITFDFCDNDRIVVYESDNQDNLDDYTLTSWSQQGFAGSNFVQSGGFWNGTGDTVGLLYNESTCSGCEIRLSITSNSKQTHKVAGALLDRNGNLIEHQRVDDVPEYQFDLSSFAGNPYTVEFYRPTVATDGDEFLVAWERAILPLGAFRSVGITAVEDAIITRRFDGNGQPLGNNTLVANSAATTTFNVANNYDLQSRPRAKLVMNWVGDRYLLTRLLLPHQVNPTGEWGQGITIRALDQNGQLIGGSFAQLIGSARAGINDSYDWDYDPINNRGLIAYFDSGSNNFPYNRFFQPTGPGTYAVSVPALPNFSGGSDPGSMRVEYDPTTKGWMLGWTSSNRTWFEARDAASAIRLTSGVPNFQNSPVANSNALACPVPQSLPMVDLRFEEVGATTTTFTDRSGYGNNATCLGNQCPLPGGVGAPDARLSAYALEFDGGNDTISIPKPAQLNGSFSLAFWYKANQAGGGPAFYITSNPPNTNNNPGFGLYIYNDSGVVGWWAGTTRSSANSSLNDGQWHFVAATYTESNRALNLYLDGNLVASGTAAQAPTPVSTMTIGGGSTRVALDQFQVYGVALSAGTVGNIRIPGALQPFCISTVASVATQSIEWNKLSLNREETFTPIEASLASTITVDSDVPTAAVTGAQYVDIDESGAAILTIGGTAQDTTSGIASVAVSVSGPLNDGAYQPARGKESWVHQFPVEEGVYTVRAKATDILGHVGNPSADKVIVADATPPQVTINALANPVKPVLTGDGNWQVTLSGTATDPAIGQLPGSGVYPSSVEVRVVSAEGATVDDQWQTATYNENSKTWTVDYVFPAARIDVTGVYTVSVRAEDRAASNGGNSTGDAGATAVLQLDHTGPAAALSPTAAARQLITEPITIDGPVTSPLSGIATLEAAFTSIEEIAALPNDVDAEVAQAQLDAGGRTWLQAALLQQGVGHHVDDLEPHHSCRSGGRVSA